MMEMSLQNYLEKIGSSLDKIWGFEIVSVGDNIIRVSNLSIALLVLIFGLIGASKLTSLLAKSISKRFQIKDSASSTVESALYYLSIVFVLFFALNISNIPLKIFTLFGGALAVGLGFGSQNILKNFISGVILLIERPIGVGDIVEVGGIMGTVGKIGSRSTSIISVDNIDIIVPNSAFLENNVINWTLRDQKVRRCITVGLAYGSDTEKAEKVLLSCVEQIDAIVDYPAPFVLFRGFGDSSLNFEIYFWIYIYAPQGMLKMESKLRHIINKELAKEGIVIAFPQLDVHMKQS
ncbi:MAG: mechanosensitive ion channel [Bdellovibrionales bacterium]|nr:mechanosensitive ion channel [Bdellovibrionales bacterium]